MKDQRSSESSSFEERMAVVSVTWRRTLDNIPTLIGRLAYMSSLRTGDAGRYQHYGISQRVGDDGTHQLLSQSHIDVFRAWLELELEPQKRDVEQHLFENGDPFWGGGQEGAKALASWIALEPWAGWLPESSRDIERELFRDDMKLVLELLRREVGVARRDPDL